MGDAKATTAPPPPPSGTFLWLSDIHLDPYFGQNDSMSHDDKSLDCSSINGSDDNGDVYAHPYGIVGCDAPLSLVEEALRQAASNGKDDKDNEYDFILITGDFVRHGTDRLDNPIDQTRNILKKVHDAIRQFFPTTQVIPVLGNNDVTPDYYLDTSSMTTRFDDDDNHTNRNILLDMFVDGMGDFLVTKEEQNTARHGGYFARRINVTEGSSSSSTRSLTFISLNTILYSVNHQPLSKTFGDDNDDPMGQFQWLEEQLSAAADSNRVVVLVGHIPPSIGSYRKSQFWHEAYMRRYFDIVQQYHPDTIGGHLFGHLHSAEFRLLSPFDHSLRDLANLDDATTVAFPLYIASSVTPVYGSNPSYRVVHYDRDKGQLLDYTTTYLDLDLAASRKVEHDIAGNTTNSSSISPPAIWQTLPSFRQTYGVPDLSLSSLKHIVAVLAESDGSEGGSIGGDTSQQQQKEQRQELWETFLSEQTVYSSTEATTIDDCPKECQVEWLCVMQATSKDSYDDCVSESMTITAVGPAAILSDPSMRGYILILTTLMVGVVVIGVGVVVARRYMKRRHYRQPHHHHHHEAAADGLTLEVVGEYHKTHHHQQSQKEEEVGGMDSVDGTDIHIEFGDGAGPGRTTTTNPSDGTISAREDDREIELCNNGEYT